MGSIYLKDTKLPIITIDKDKKETQYEYISFGSEGYVYAYDDKTVFKIFLHLNSDLLRRMTFEKIEELSQFSDPQIAFPVGLVGFEDGRKEGYFMPRVKVNPRYKDFLQLRSSQSQTEKIDLLLKGEAPLKRAHENGIYFVDIKGTNILINEDGVPVYVDVDSAGYSMYSHSLNLYRAQWFEKLYKRTLSPEDNDKFLYAILALQTLITDNWYIKDLTSSFLDELIRRLDVSEEVKGSLRYIFSDRSGKPYIGQILSGLDPTRPLITREEINKLHKRF